MDPDSTFLLLLLSSATAAAWSGKFVRVDERKSWFEARMHCCTSYTDLAAISSKQDDEDVRQQVCPGETLWIGMMRQSTTKWLWSGGGEVTTFFWALTQPSNINKGYSLIKEDGWYDAGFHYIIPFFCFRVEVVMEKKTWEEALEHCREKHRDLASVGSETEQLLIQMEVNKHAPSQPLWIALWFFPGGWRWADGHPREYWAWRGGNQTQCPGVRLGCAAVQVGGQTGSSTAGDANVKRSASSRSSSSQNQANNNSNNNNNNNNNNVPGVLDVTGETAAEIRSAWETHDCEERLHFICD